MSGSNNFQQWNPTGADQLSDAGYTADSQRSGGATSGIFMPQTANKLFYQTSTFVAAFGEMLKAKGYVISDADFSALIAALTNVLTKEDIADLSTAGIIQATSGLLSSLPYGADITKFLRNDGEWINPNTNKVIYSEVLSAPAQSFSMSGLTGVSSGGFEIEAYIINNYSGALNVRMQYNNDTTDGNYLTSFNNGEATARFMTISAHGRVAKLRCDIQVTPDLMILSDITCFESSNLTIGTVGNLSQRKASAVLTDLSKIVITGDQEDCFGIGSFVRLKTKL